MNVSGAGTGALVRWNAAQAALGPPSDRRRASHAAGSSAGAHGHAAKGGVLASPPRDDPSGSETGRADSPAIRLPAGAPRALAQFFAHGLEPARIGTLIDTYA